MFHFSRLSVLLPVSRAARRPTIATAAAAALATVTVLGVAAAAGAAPLPAPKLVFSPPGADYGQVVVGRSAVKDFQLANQSRTASGALTVTVSSPAAFTITADTCSETSLGPGKSCSITVRFAPATAGTVTAALTAAGKKAGVITQASLTGTGAPPALYWSNFWAGTIVEANLDGTNPQVIASGQDSPHGVAVDSTHVYWANWTAGTVMEANLDGTSQQVIATAQVTPTGVTTSAP